MPIHTQQTITTRQDASSSLKENFNDIVARAKSRDAGIWTAFIYNKPGTDTDSWRGTIFGLYSAVNNNRYSYLIELSTDDLTNLYNNFYYELAKIDADQTAFLTELVIKEHLAEVDDIMIRNGFVTKEQKNDAQREYYAARLEALEADEKALETRRMEVESAKEKIQIEIENLQYQIEQAELSEDEVDIEVLQKNLAIERERLRLAEISYDVLDYQRRVSEASLQVSELEVDRQRIATGMRKLDAEEYSQTAKLTELDARIALMNVELIQEGVKLVRITQEESGVENDLKKIDLGLLREIVQRVKLVNEETKIESRITAGDARLASLEADSIRIDSQFVNLDVVSKGLDVDLAKHNLTLEKIDLESDRITNQLTAGELSLLEEDVKQLKMTNDLVRIEANVTSQQARLSELDAELSRLSASEIDMDAAIEQMNVALIRSGVRLKAISNETLRVGNQSSKIDVDLLREVVRRVRLANDQLRINANVVKGDARLASLEADSTNLDARSDKLDAAIEGLNNDIAMEGVRLIRLSNEKIDIQNDYDKLAMVDDENYITNKRLSGKNYQATAIYSARIALLEAELNSIDPETDYYTQRLAKLEELIEARKRQIFESFAASVTATKNGWIEADSKREIEDEFNQEKLLFQTDEEIPDLEQMDAERLKIHDAQVKAGKYVGQAIVDRAYAMANADIQNTLTHILGSSGS